jgi:hypothetical protein
MKYLKLLGLGLAAACALAALPVGSASATVICKTTTNPCSNAYPEKTLVHAVLKSNTSTKFSSTDGMINDTCTESTFQGETENRGGKGVNVKLPLATLTFGKCGTKTAVLKNGTLELIFKEKGSGTVQSFGMEVTVEATTGASCVYGTAATTTLGTWTEPASEVSDTVLDVNASLARISGSGFLCPTPITWTAEYTITSPVPAYLAGE